MATVQHPTRRLNIYIHATIQMTYTYFRVRFPGLAQLLKKADSPIPGLPEARVKWLGSARVMARVRKPGMTWDRSQMARGWLGSDARSEKIGNTPQEVLYYCSFTKYNVITRKTENRLSSYPLFCFLGYSPKYKMHRFRPSAETMCWEKIAVL